LLKTVEEKGVMAENALSDFGEQEDESRWIFSQELFGTKVWYRQEEEDGGISTKSILILGKSITEWTGIEIPEPTGWTTKRMSFRALQIMVEPTSSDSTKCCLICSMDLNAIVPQSLLNMIMRKVTGLIMIFLEKEVRRMQEDPDNSEHAKRVTSDTFYTEQLTNKMDRFLAALPEDSPVHNPKPKKVTPPPPARLPQPDRLANIQSYFLFLFAPCSPVDHSCPPLLKRWRSKRKKIGTQKNTRAP
jgi:hypothetical protein